MTDYTYTARNLGGQCVEGVVTAGSQREAIATLTSQQLFPIELSVSTGQSKRSVQRHVKPQTMSQFYVQLASLLRSGVPLLRSLEVLGKQTNNPALSFTVYDLHNRITEGESLAEAMARHPKAFDELAVSIVRAGGEGGFMEEALERVAKFTDQQAELKSRVMGAMAYPIFLCVFSVIIVSVLIVFFVPKFEALFARLRERGELPALTDWLLWFSDSVTRYGIFIAIAIAGLVMLLRAQLATEAGRWFLDRWRLQIPQAGLIYRNLAVSRFCRVLGTLLNGGVPIVLALKISSDSTGNRVLSKTINNASENITAGESLAAPLMASGHFPSDVIEMIAVAEQSNTLETVLTDIAESLEKQTWRRLDLLVRLIEPIMLLVMASLVLVIVVALLMPMLKSAMAM
ncbi:MAG: type II secretion system F family protein [Planctomycetales bacterium]|nr:type II secretion system F family protein [Planctomycetales bacterium]